MNETVREPRRARGEKFRVRSAVAALCLCAILTGGCAATSTDEPERSQGNQTTSADQPSQSSGQEKAAKTARVVCGPGGTRVLTPRVEARPDGVHFVLDNRFDAEAGYSVEYPEGGGEGYSVPRGESEHVGDFPPGKVRIGCDKPPVDGTDIEHGALEVVDPNGVYKPVELECKSGMIVSGGPAYAPGVKGKRGDLVEITRRSFSDQIRDGDEVELAGYTESRDQRTVRVVRGGRVVATVEYTGRGKGWLQDHYEACASF
ncbi:MAG TPA: hypothetical protein VFI90_03145 [Rubrobacter sp.]|nr:hypothetical protein [Rubrobacter sp.]